MRPCRKKEKNPIDIAKEFIHDGKDPDGFREEWIPPKGILKN